MLFTPQKMIQKVLRYIDKIKKRTTKKSSASLATSAIQKTNVLNLKKKTPLIEIHLPVIKDYYFENKKIILSVVSLVLCVGILSSFFHAKASTSVFYPSNCLGGWQHPQNAANQPSLENDAALEDYNSANSAVLGNSSAQIYCGTFSGEIPKDTLPKKFSLSFRWSVDDGTIVHPEPTPFGAGDVKMIIPPSGVSEPVQSDNQPVAETDGVIVEEAPEGIEENAIIPPQGPEPAVEAPVVDSPESQSFLQKIFRTVHAQESENESTTEISPVAPESLPASAPIESVPVEQQAIIPEQVQQDASTPEQHDTIDAFVTIAYTLDGSIWNTLGTVSQANWRDSQFDIPLRAWDDMSKVQISITPIQTLDRQPIVYLDAMEILVDYDEGSVFSKPVVRIKSSAASVLDGRSDYTSDEAPAFAVVDPRLSTYDIAELVKEEKAEVVQDLDGVLTRNTERVSSDGANDTNNSSSGFLNTIKDLFTDNPTASEKKSETLPPEQNNNPATPETEETVPQEEVTPAQEKLEVIEGAPPEDIAPAQESVPEPIPVIEQSQTVESVVPAQEQTTPLVDPVAVFSKQNFADAISYFFSKQEQKKIVAEAPAKKKVYRTHVPMLFGPLIANAAGLFDSARITNAVVLDLNGNPTTIKTTIKTVTIDGESKEGVEIEKPSRRFRPGGYTLEVTVETAEAIIISEQDFTWGVLAINTDKSIYAGTDTAFLQMGVLDDKGNTLCDAPMELSVKSPSGAVSNFSTEAETIQKSKKCARNNIVEVADYYAHYPIPGEPGTYIMSLTAHTDNGTRTVIDTFDVGNPDFDVSRTAPTRIYPFSKYDYPMTIRVTPKHDWKGTIVETIPAGFVISPPKSSQKYDTLKSTDELITLTWDVELKAGEETVLGYLFKGPEVSPEFFLIGPLEFYNEGTGPETAIPIFVETREWQIADDATCTAAANGNWNTSGTWSCGHVPNNTDSVVINASVTVTMDVASATSIQGVTINGTLNTITSGTSYALTTTTLTIGATGTLTANASTITLTGTTGTLFTITAGGTFTEGTSEVVVTSASGTPTLLSAAETFHKLTINSAATVINDGAAVTIANASGAKLYIQTGVFNARSQPVGSGSGNGTLQIGAGAVLCLGGASGATNATCDSSATSTTAITMPVFQTYTISSGSTVTPWYNSAWGYRTKITIDKTKVPSTQTDFPVLISKTDNRFRTVANGGHMGNAGATDMVITSSDATTKLNHQIEYYVATTGQMVVWVKVPSLSSSTDTELYIYYGNAGVADQQNASGTWDSNFKQVLHVGDGTTLSVTDSTSNGYNGTNNGGAATTGVVDGGIVLSSGGNRIDNANGLYTMIGGSATHTESLWVRVDCAAFCSGTNYIFDGDHNNNGQSFVNIGNSTIFQWGYGGFGTFRGYTLSTTLAVGTWAYISMVKSAAGDNGSLYVNGTLQSTYTGTLGNLPNNTTSSHWGNYHGSTSTTLVGAMDEMRISNTNRSANWITTEYNTMNSPSTFIPTWATEEQGNIPAGTVIYLSDADTAIANLGAQDYGNLYLKPLLTASHAYTIDTGSALDIAGDFTINPTRASAATLTVNLGGTTTVAAGKTTTITGTTSAVSKLDTRPSGSDYDLSTGFLTIASGSELDATSSSANITLTGVTGTLMTNTGTFTEGTSTVSVTSATGPVTLISAAETFHKLTINSASSSTVVNSGAATTIADASGSALTVTSGVFNDSGSGIATSGSSNNTLTLGSGGTLCLGGSSGANTATTCDTGTTSTTTRSLPSFASYSFNAASTVIYLSNADTTVSSTPTYGNLTLRPKITTGRAYTLGNTMSVAGNFDSNPQTGAAALTTSLGSGGLTVTGSVTLQGTTSTSTLTTTGSNYQLTAASINITTGDTLTANGSTITLNGTSGTLLTNAGTFTQGTSTVSVTSASGPVALLSAAQTLHILTINSASASTVVNAGAALTIDNASGAALTITSGVFNDSGNGIATSGSTNNTLTLGSGGTLCLGGASGANTATTCDTSATSTTTRAMPSFANYSFNASSTVIYLSDAATTISNTPTYGNLIFRPRFVATARAYTLGGAMTINGDFTINPTNFAALLTVNAAGTITVDSAKTTTISGTTATSKLCLKATTCNTGTSYNLSTGFLNIATQGTLDATSASSTITLSGTGSTLFTRAGTFTITSGTPTVIMSGNGAATINSGTITFYDLTQTGTGTKTVGGSSAITINNNLTISAGTFAPNAQTVTGSGTNTVSVASGATLNVDASTWAGNYSSFETRTLSSGSTVDYTLAGTQTVDSTLTYDTLTISGASGTKSLNGTTTANATLNLNGSATLDTDGTGNYALNAAQISFAGGTLTANASTITVSGTTGTPITYSSGTFTAGTSTVAYTGNNSGGNTTINTSISYASLTVNNASETYVLGATLNLTAAGTLTVTDGTFSTANNIVNMGHLSIVSSSTAIFSAGSSALNITGTSGTLLTRGSSGTFTRGTSAVTLSGNGAATINSGTFTGTTNKFYDLIQSGNNTKTLGAAIEVESIFGVTGGTFAASSNAMTLSSATIGASGTLDAGSGSHTVSGNWTNGGAFTKGTSTITLNGTGTQTLSGTMTSSTGEFYNLIITNTSGVNPSGSEVTGMTASVDFADSATVTNGYTVSGAHIRVEYEDTKTYTFANINWAGTSGAGNSVYFRNSATSGAWLLVLSGTQSITYLDVSRSDASGGNTALATDGTSTDSGNNTNWSFFTPPSITFDLDAYATAVTSTETAAPYSVALGALTTVAASNSDESTINAIWFDLDTNASGGAIVSVVSLFGELRSASAPADDIPSATGTMTPGVANYGICAKRNGVTSGTFNKVSPFNGATCTTGHVNDVGAVTTSAQTIYNTGGGAVTGARAQIMVNAENSAITPAHNDYTDTLTFIVTGTF